MTEPAAAMAPSTGGFAIFHADGSCTVDAEILAPALGLTPSALMQQLQAGLVFQASERGIGADEGLMRLTFRYRHREFQAIVDSAGRIVEPKVVQCA